MVLSDLSIKRPVLAAVMSAVLVIFGLFAYAKLPVREYPDTDPPVLSITTVYRGASAEVIEAQVTQIVEESVSGIEGVKRISSTSRDESSSVGVEFTLERDIDDAANDVRDPRRPLDQPASRGGRDAAHREARERRAADPVAAPDQRPP